MRVYHYAVTKPVDGLEYGRGAKKERGNGEGAAAVIVDGFGSGRIAEMPRDRQATG